jgi:stearoyl-CoA desaturase (delta-9 desaturase)
MMLRTTTLNHVKSSIFWIIHLVPFLAIWTGVTPRAIILFIVLYWAKMFLITGVYHRYFSHRSYKMSRGLQFILGFLGTSCLQRGPLWWASRHRHHHRFSDQAEDAHSPLRGFYVSHVGWVVDEKNNATDLSRVRDLAKFPELLWLERWHQIAPIILTTLCYLIDGWAGVVVGMGWSAVASWHATFTINSLAHLWGSRRYATSDTSRNNWLLALITMGEGWHNNHHHVPISARQGFYWWEIDFSYYMLRALEKLGLIWDLKQPTPRALSSNLIR